MKINIVLILLTCLFSHDKIFAAGLRNLGHRPDTTQTIAEPEIFVPGPVPFVATSVAAPAFTPDGKTFFMQAKFADSLYIVGSHFAGGHWTAPLKAPFSTTNCDLEPAFDPHGKYLVFASSRPATDTGKKIDERYNGSVYAGKGGNLWRVNFTKQGWSKPERLPDVINANTSVFSPAIAGNGNLYFMRADSMKKFHLYCAKLVNGKYQAPERLPFSNLTTWGDFDPAIAKDESFIIFGSARSPAPPKTADLFIVFRTSNGWGEPVDLRIISPNVHGNEARLSPDNKTLYFSNSRNVEGVTVDDTWNIWKVDLSGFLKAHGL